MKTQIISIYLGQANYELEVIFKRGQYNKYLQSSQSGEFRMYTVDLLKESEYDNKLFVQAVLNLADDKNSNNGHWYAHCNGFAKDVAVGKGDTLYNYLTLNTWRNYNKGIK